MTKLMRVYETLREEILDGELAPGARLVLHELAARLGVSPIPVREALRLLERDDLVEVFPHKRVAVKALPIEEAIWASELRLILEPVAVRDAVPHLSKGQVAAAERAFAELKLWAASDQFTAFLASYAEFFDTIVAATPNRRLVRSIAEFRMVARRFRAVYRVDRIPQGVEEDLAAVLHAIEERDPEAAFVAVTEHRRRELSHLQGWANGLESQSAKHRSSQRRPLAVAGQLSPLINLW